MSLQLKLMEIVQQVEYIDIEKIEYVLKNKKAIRDWAYIIHDKDINEKGELKKPHIHIALRFHNQTNSKHVSQWFDIPEQYISRCKGKWADMLKYLTHKNALDKYQYEDSEVKSNFDWNKTIEQAEKKKEEKKKDERKEEIINMIANGDIREYNYHEFITPVEYNKYSKAINDSFKYRVEMLNSKGADRKMDCVFITGKSGTGKSTYAKKICKDKGLSYYVSSSSNDIMDGYKGQDVLILDDLRPNSIDLVDLLKLLDNNTGSLVKSRFKNKFLECKMVIITTVLSIQDFYLSIQGSHIEPIEQFKRRCKTYVRLDNDYMYLSPFDYKVMDYHTVYTLENPVKLEVYSSMKTDEEIFQESCDVLGLKF